jgi:tetratricopeptide (TPR) repeat protein
MYYRPQEKKRRPLVTLSLILLLLVMVGFLALLLAIYVGYLDINTPTIAEQFAPTPTPTRSPILYIADGDELFAQGKLPQAIAAYEEAIARNPTNDVPYIRQSRLLVFSRDTAKAIKRGGEAVALNPGSAENLAHYCRALDWEALYAEAIDACTCAIELDPTYAEGYAFLSEVYADLGNWRLAQSYAQQALDANFQSMDAHHNMGYAMEVQGRYAQAVDFYENAIKLAPNLAPLYVDAGRIYHNGLADYDQAADRFKKAIKLSPFDPEAYDLLGWSFYFSGEYVRAIDALEQSLSLDPTYVNPYRRESAWGHLGTLFYTRQNFEESTEYLIKAIEVGESEFLRRARQVEIFAQVETLTGSKAVPVLRGKFTGSGNPNYVAHLTPVNYLTELNFDTEQSCGELIKQSIQYETTLLGATQAITFTRSFQEAAGSATIDPTTDMLLLDVTGLPQPHTTPYEIKATFWPNRTDSIGFFQPDAGGRAVVNIRFEEKLAAPIEYYYETGLAFAYLEPPQCDKAVPWLLEALKIDSSAYSPAWAGLRICPSSSSPPTPIPTVTPLPEATPQK